MPQGWPLTGRAEELRLVGTLVRRRDGPAGVVLAGAAGVGKTRLAREALAAAAQRGALIRWAAATASARALPLGAFTALVGAVGSDPTQLVRRAADALLAGAGPAGVVVGVDDGHLLDDLSALLVHELVLRRAATVVLTLRSGEPAPDAVTALWKDGHLQRLELQPLSGPETTMLLEAALGGPVVSSTARRLWSITRGNALYLRQLVDGELEAGRLNEVVGVWQWSREPHHLPPGLVELVESRIGSMAAAERDVLDVLAFGEPLGVRLVAGIAGAAAIEVVEARGLVAIYPDGRRLQARLAHPLYGEVRRDRCGQLRARRLRGRIASALADTGSRRTNDILRRAVLALDSDLAPNAALLAAAASGAAELVDAPLAERLARAAIAAGGGFEPHLTLASVLVGLGRTADAELAALGKHARTDADRARAAVLHVSSLAWLWSRPVEAEAALDAAEFAVSDDDARAQLAALRALLDAFLGRPERAAESAAFALSCPRLVDHAVAFACLGGVVAHGALGRVDEIGALVDRGTTAAARSRDAAWLAVPLVGWHVIALCLAGNLQEASTAAADGRVRFAEQTFPTVISEIVLGWAELAQGRLGTSLRLLREARAGLAPYGPAGGWLFACLLDLPRALAISGETAAAQRALTDLEAAKHLGFLAFDSELMLARAWVVACEGSIREAIAAAHEAADMAASSGQRAREVLALHTAVCFGDRTVADRLAELATQVDGPRAPAAAAHAAALATDNGDALLAASSQLRQMGALLLAADAAAQAAAAHNRNGRRGSAHLAAARAHRLAELCEGARTPALRAMAQPLPLTVREREIVTLAAAGHSNREIAARLVLSIRTVEGHLYRACAKLGTSDRASLSTILHGE